MRDDAAIFPDIAEMNRAFGRVSLRRVFSDVSASDLASHTIARMRRPPQLPEESAHKT